ncbi:MAG: EutN/CcmL family microcompartment protein [Verrucomicrobia bacterium]|nr:EutN/CcmL family microcompartment protein [Verrucomicrobiota bacterium]
MLIGRVVGNVVASQKAESLEGLKFLVVREMTVEAKETDSHIVAADAVGAGPGDVVLYATGSSARQTPQTDKRPADAVIMAIVDSWDIGGTLRYEKAKDAY